MTKPVLEYPTINMDRLQVKENITSNFDPPLTLEFEDDNGVIWSLEGCYIKSYDYGIADDDTVSIKHIKFEEDNKEII